MKPKNLTLLLFLLLIINTITAQQKFTTGAIMDAEEEIRYNEMPMKSPNLKYQTVELESSASLKSYLPNIENQGQYGTCVGWSTTYYGRTLLDAKAKNNTNTEIISQLAYAPIFTYLQSNVDNDINCKEGAYITKALEVLKTKGAPLYKDFNYMCTSQIPQDIMNLADDNKLKTYAKIFDKNDDYKFKTEMLKRSLSNGYPVIIGFDVYSSFNTATTIYKKPTSYDAYIGGHAMCVIGYDDNKYGGAVEIVNSWGTNWGNSGFIWVPYQDFFNLTKYAYEMIPEYKTPENKNHLAGKLSIILKNNLESVSAKKLSDKEINSYLKYMEVEEEQQSIGDYKLNTPLVKDTRIRFTAQVNKPAYVYLLSTDSEGRNDILFPHKEEINPYISYENTDIIIPPSQNAWIRLGGDVESDHNIAIFSLEEIDINEVKTQLDNLTQGTLLSKLYTIFGDKLISKNEITLSDTEIAFDAQFTKGTMAALIIDIPRK